MLSVHLTELIKYTITLDAIRCDRYNIIRNTAKRNIATIIKNSNTKFNTFTLTISQHPTFW